MSGKEFRSQGFESATFSGNHLTETFKTSEENRKIGSRKPTIRFWNQTMAILLYFLHTLIHSEKQETSLYFNIKVDTTDGLEILWKVRILRVV